MSVTRRCLVMICLLPAAAMAKQGYDLDAAGEAIGAVTSLSGSIDGATSYCARFPALTTQAHAVRLAWHKRNGAWEQAAASVRAEVKAYLASTGQLGDPGAFDREASAFPQREGAKIVAVFDAMPDDRERIAGCRRILATTQDGALDVDKREAAAKHLPLLRRHM